EFGEGVFQRRFVASDHFAHQGIGELAPDGCSYLADLLDRRQAVEPRHQGILKGSWNGERRQRPVESIAVRVLDQDVPFNHCLCELLDEQRVAVGLATIWFITSAGSARP